MFRISFSALFFCLNRRLKKRCWETCWAPVLEDEACWALQDQAIDPEVAEGVLDEVGLQHLNPMSLNDEKWNEQISHCLTKKRPAKKFFKKYFFLCPPFAAGEVQGGAAHGEKGEQKGWRLLQPKKSIENEQESSNFVRQQQDHQN